MAIAVGDRIPSATLKFVTPDGVEDIDLAAHAAGKKIVMFALPGAFTPTCSAKHLPGFIEKASEIKAKGVDEIICTAVNDQFVMKAWGESSGVGDAVTMVADGNGTFAEAAGLGLDLTVAGLGQRSQRYVMVIDDGVVQHLAVEEAGQFEVSSASAVLKAL